MMLCAVQRTDFLFSIFDARAILLTTRYGYTLHKYIRTYTYNA